MEVFFEKENIYTLDRITLFAQAKETQMAIDSIKAEILSIYEKEALSIAYADMLQILSLLLWTSKFIEYIDQLDLSTDFQNKIITGKCY